jgi:GH43 family beta-xylosidase
MHTNTEILKELWHSQMKIREGKEYIFSAANRAHAHQVSIFSYRTGMWIEEQFKPEIMEQLSGGDCTLFCNA